MKKEFKLVVITIFFLVFVIFSFFWWAIFTNQIKWDWIVSAHSDRQVKYRSKKIYISPVTKTLAVNNNTRKRTKTTTQSGTITQSGTTILAWTTNHSWTTIESWTITQSGTTTQSEIVTQTSKRSITDNFDTDKIYEEIREAKRNFSDRWRLNSGAFFNVKNWVWSSLQWALAEWSKWQLKYAVHNGWLDTDWWYYPQNLFRLVLNEKFQDYSQSAYYKINKYNLSTSPNRFESNWLYLFNRYVDQYNLYYTWIRVDWKVIIKKKYNSQYTTLASKKIFDWVYNRDTNPNLIPTSKWIWIKSEVKNLATGGVSINVYTDLNNDWIWEPALSYIDNTTTSIKTSWYAWVRTDFMDFEMDRYNIQEL